MNGASPKQVSKVVLAAARPLFAPRRAGWATAALGLGLVGGLTATTSSALAQAVGEPVAEVEAPAAAAPSQDVAPLVDAPQVPAPGLAAQDPFEGFNRASFGVSMGLDRVLIAPVARGYMAVTPKPVRNRVSSVVYNLGEPSTALNDVLQGRPKRLGVTTSRFVINSTIGLLGLFDVAAGMGLPGHGADFGQTFGRYGVKPGPYLYVPVMGPLSFREGVGRALDFATDPVGIIGGGYKTTFGAARLGATVVDTRARADPAFRALDDSVDPYVTARSAYGQYREAFIREATGEVQILPDFDDATSAPTTSTATPQ